MASAARALSSLQKLQREIDKKTAEGVCIDPGLIAEISSEVKNLKLDVSGAEGGAGADDNDLDLDDDI